MHHFINEDLTSSTNISYQDRGFRFGDGLFETISINNYKPFLLNYHLERLSKGLQILKITTDLEAIKKKLFKLIDYNNHKNGLARIIISRGIGSKGYLPYQCPKPTIIIETCSSPPNPIELASLCISTFEKTSPKSLPTGIKLLQGLNSTLAKLEAEERGYFDSILLNQHQQICEVSSGNVFWARDKKIYTPSADCGLVEGIIRRRIMEIFPVITGKFTIDDLLAAEEIFITNIIWVALSVKSIEEKSFNAYSLAEKINKKISLEKN